MGMINEKEYAKVIAVNLTAAGVEPAPHADK